MSLYSTPEQLARIASLVTNFAKLPFAAEGAVPGSALMAILAEVQDARTLETYDFVDVVHVGHEVGWQVKSTKSGTPVTWKRAKIPHKEHLIADSRKSAAGTQRLGDAIIEFCNEHAVASMSAYKLKQIGYARLVVFEDGTAQYFERELVSIARPELFSAKEFSWKWSTPKKTTKKEQLQSLHGTHIPTGKKWWAWHGLGENQLHFSGERAWWPSGNAHSASFRLPSPADRWSMQDFIELIDSQMT